MWKRKKEAANNENESCFCIRIFLFLPCFQRFNVNFTVRKDGLFSCFFLRKADRLRSEIRCEAFLFAYENEDKEKF